MIRMMNKKVAVVPFVTVETKVTTKNALPYIQQKAELYEQEVVYGTSDGEFAPGDRVLLHGDSCKLPFSKARYRLGDDGPDFIIVPYEQILGVIKKGS